MKKTFKTSGYALTALLAAAYMVAQPAMAGMENPDYQNVALHYSVDQEHKLALKYDVYAGGFKALNATLLMDLDKKAYDMALEAETQGFIGNLFPWKATYNTSGHAEKGVLIPTVHTGRSIWRDNVKITEMNYSPKGKILKTTTQADGKTVTDRNIDDALADDTLDLLTGTLAMMQNVKNTHKCTGKFPVFDGKRRFNITMTDGGKEYLPPSKYSQFEGEAVRCTLKVEPVAGFKKKDAKRGWMAIQNHTEQHRKLPTIWLAKMKDSGQVVPVRMEIASDYGSVVAHLSGGSDN